MKNNSSHRDLESALINVRKHHFNSINGKYKGIPLSKSKFILDANSNYNKEICELDNVQDDLLNMNLMRLKNIPILMGSRSYNHWKKDKVLCDDTSMADDMSINLYFDQNEIVESMGAGSQVESNLSQFRTDIDEKSECYDDTSTNICIDEDVPSHYNTLNPMFQTLVSNAILSLKKNFKRRWMP